MLISILVSHELFTDSYVGVIGQILDKQLHCFGCGCYYENYIGNTVELCPDRLLTNQARIIIPNHWRKWEVINVAPHFINSTPTIDKVVPQYSVLLLLITSPPEGVARYCFHPVCVSVCLSVYLCVRPIFWYFISRLLEEISIWNLYRILIWLYSIH